MCHSKVYYFECVLDSSHFVDCSLDKVNLLLPNARGEGRRFLNH